MSEGIATFKNVSMGSLCDPRKQEEILNDLWVEWVKLALELELENAVRRRFPGHSAGSYGRLARWIDELGFIASDVRFLVGRLWRATVSWPNSGESVQRSRTARRPQKRIGELVRVVQRHFSRIRSSVYPTTHGVLPTTGRPHGFNETILDLSAMTVTSRERRL
jgi:hypothetical protein